MRLLQSMSLRSVFISLLGFGSLVLMVSCGGKDEPARPLWQSYEMEGTDTINRVDTAGLKQGPWYFFADKGKKNKPGIKPKLLVKGTYVDDKREGTWYYFSIDGTPSDTVVYRNDFPQDQ